MNTHQESRQRFPGTGRGENQRVLVPENGGPAHHLRRRDGVECVAKPCGNRRMEAGE